MKYAVAVDVGGTNVRIGLVDENYQLHAFEKRFREEIMVGESPSDGLAEYIAEFLKKNANGLEVAAVAVGVPSTLDSTRRVVLSTPNIPGMDNLPLADILSEKLGIPAFIERDVCMLFSNDSIRYNVPEKGVAIGVYLGTGVGNAISIDGKLFVGANGAAGELGHIPVLGDDSSCGCGNEGCIELYAGGKYLEKIAEENFDGVWIKKIFVEHGDSPEVQKYLETAACAIATEINLLDPVAVVLGGGVPAMEAFPHEELGRRVRNHTRKPYPEKTLKFIWSEDADMNGVIGGGIYAHKMLKEAK